MTTSLTSASPLKSTAEVVLRSRSPRSKGGASRCSSPHPDAERALAWIGALYQVDRDADGDAAVRAELRRTRAQPILDELKAWLWTHAEMTTLSIGKAAAYTLGIWDRLTRFVDDTRIPLDNNATERAIRGPVMRGSLCVTPSSTGKPQGSRVRSIATRALAAAA